MPRTRQGLPNLDALGPRRPPRRSAPDLDALEATQRGLATDARAAAEEMLARGLVPRYCPSAPGEARRVVLVESPGEIRDGR